MTVKKCVVCPKCGKSDRLEYNRIFRHIGETIGAGGGATFGSLGIKVGTFVSAATLTAIGATTGTIVGGMSGLVIGFTCGKDLGAKFGKDVENILRPKFRCQRCKIIFRK